jgi:hydroxylamine reductase
MFCYQCEQTAGGAGCTRAGVCGKDAETSDLQDLLIHAAKGVAMYARRARRLGVVDRKADVFVLEALFATVTNVDFDPLRLQAALKESIKVRSGVRAAYESACRSAGREPERLAGPAEWMPAGDLEGLVGQGRGVALDKTIAKLGDDLGGLYSLVLYGLKGMAAYADHAQILGVEDDEVYAFFHETLDFLSGTTLSSEGLLAKALEVGGMNLKVMELLDRANTSAYGHPEPARVRITPRKGKAILVSGHDLKDLEAVLKQTEGSGINVYTHGEMLPAHGYPGLRKYPHLAGNYGGAWQNQREEFEAFPGAVLMTTNCIQKPKETYKARLFTTGLVAWPGVRHLGDKDFSPLIEAALGEEGFAGDGEDRSILVGFGHRAVLSAADRVVEAVKSG